MGNPTFYNSASEFIGDGTIQFDADTFGLMLLDSGHTIDPDDDFRNDVEADELAATGNYTAGGVVVANPTWTRVTGVNGGARFTFDTPVFPDLTAVDIRYAVLYKRRGGASSADELVCVWDLGQNFSPGGVEFKLLRSVTEGVFTLRGAV